MEIRAGSRFQALSLVRPGGSLIAAGRKTLEVRRWSPTLAPSEDLLIVENARYLREGDADEGLALALVRVARVRPFRPEDMPAACASTFEEGWLAWELTHLRRLISPLTVPALRKLYRITIPSDAQILHI